MQLSYTDAIAFGFCSLSICFFLTLNLRSKQRFFSYLSRQLGLNQFIQYLSNSKHNKVWVISIDYDGTFDDGHEVIKDWINQFRNQFSRVILMIGSIRQSRFTDELNDRYNNNGSIRRIEDFAYENEFEFDSFLIGDALDNREAGETYLIWSTQDDIALKASSNILTNKTLKFLYDKKTPIVHAQMHHIKEVFPNKDITYTLIDDREDIGAFLNKHITTSIPPRVTYNFVLFNDFLECEPFFKPIPSTESLFDTQWRLHHTNKTPPCYPLIKHSLAT